MARSIITHKSQRRFSVRLIAFLLGCLLVISSQAVCFTVFAAEVFEDDGGGTVTSPATIEDDGGLTETSPATIEDDGGLTETATEADSSGATAVSNKKYDYIANRLTDGKTVSTKGYVLRVCTGASAGNGISCFEIRYKSSDSDIIRSEFILPHEGKTKSFNFGNKVGINFTAARRSQFLWHSYAYKSEYPMEDVENHNYSYKKSKGVLKQNSTDDLYFEPSYSLDSIVDIRAYGRYKSGAENAWSFKGFYLYEVKKNLGLIPVNNVSEEFLNAFEGKLIAKTTSSGNLTWAGKDGLFVFSDTKTGKFKLDYTSSDYSTANDSVIVEVDIADTLNASLSFFSASYGANMLTNITTSKCIGKIFECLSLEIEYTDSYGQSLSVNLPLVTSYCADLLASIESNSAINSHNDKILGLFQQGDTIAFKTYLPNYSTVKKCKIKYNHNPNEYTNKIFDFTLNSVYSSLVKDDDTFGVSAIRIYNGKAYDLSYLYDGARYEAVLSDETATPLFYCLTTSYAGYPVKLYNTAAVFAMTKYERGDRVKASLGSNTYLFAITTDAAAEIGGTTDEITMKLNYKKSNGEVVTSDEYNVRDLSDNFYGEWQSKKVQTIWSPQVVKYEVVSDCGSYYNTAAGRTLYFTLNISDVASFTSATLSIDGDDDWQMSSFCIYQLSSLGKRSVTWKDDKVTAYVTRKGVISLDTDKVITREFDGIMCVQYERSVLVQSDEAKVISFSDGSVGTDEADWGKYSYYMSYEDTKQNFGFTKSRYVYTVNVLVCDDVDGDEGCGSKNQFFFQLIFANGKSGYVLANQQLSADGFRAGEESIFQIAVNRDYGELRAVHIIPQNPNNTDEAFDKLKIDTITISKSGENGVCLNYKIEIKDWISIDYSDTAAQDSVAGQPGKSESDIARTYVVTSTGYSTKILVSVTTGEYGDSEQFSGHIFADIKYRDSNGIDRVLPDIDVTKAMYDYAGRNAVGKISDNGVERLANDKSFMMRGCKTDRFEVVMNDVSQILSIQFNVFSKGSGTWNISNVTMYLVGTEGQRTINSNQEYEKAGEKTYLTSSDTDTYPVYFSAGETKYSSEIQMLDNTINVNESENGVTAQVDYVPANKDDTMNVYVYMSSDSTKIQNYGMKCSVQYSVNVAEVGADIITGVNYQKSVTLKSDKKNNVFYAHGVNASGLVNVCSVSVKADSYSNVTAHVDRIVVEHVRSGVAINSYTIQMYNAAAYPLELTGVTGNETVQSTAYRQVVEFMLTDDSKKMLLGYKTDDIAVSITYTALDGDTSHKLISPNAFLSETDTTVIGGGTVCRINFSQSDVSRITGISVIGMGKVINNVGIKNAYAANYMVDSAGEETCLGWYSFGLGVATLTSSSRTMTLTSASDDAESYTAIKVVPVSMTVKTSAAQTNSESGTTCPVWMEIGYTDFNGNERYATYNDINSYSVSGSTATDATITLRFLINNLTSLRSVEFKPYTKTANTGNASWSIETISMTYNLDGKEIPVVRAVNAVATESSPLIINLNEAKISVRAFSHNPTTNASYNNTFSGTGEAAEGILINSDQTITFTPTLTGSRQGLTCTCYKIIDGTSIIQNSAIKINGSSTSINNVVFGSDSDTLETGTYKVVFKSVEFADTNLAIRVVVREAAATTTEATTADNQDTTTEETTSDKDTIIETTTEEKWDKDDDTTVADEMTTEAQIEDKQDKADETTASNKETTTAAAPTTEKDSSEKETTSKTADETTTRKSESHSKSSDDDIAAPEPEL